MSCPSKVNRILDRWHRDENRLHLYTIALGFRLVMTFLRLINLKNEPYTFIICALLAISLFVFGISNPALNWDIIGYTAAAHYQSGVRNDSLRNKTYAEIQSITNVDYFRELTDNSTYRKTVYENSDALTQQMPFYTIRMAYLGTMRLASKIFPLSIAQSTYFISSFFSALCVFFLFYLFRPKNSLLMLAFPFIILFSGFKELATLSTPDSIAAFFVLVTVFFFQKNRYFLTLLSLTLIPFIRTDFIIFAGILAFLLILKNEKLKAFFLVIPPTLAYLYINGSNSNYGYLKIFNFTLIAIDPFPATMEIKTNLTPYIQAYIAGFTNLIGHKHFIVYLAYLLFWLKYVRPRNIQRYNEQVFIILGFLSLHMILFPAYFERFFVWCVAVAGLQLAQWIYELKTKKDIVIN